MNKLIKILFLVNLLIFNKVIANPNINIKTGILMDYHSDEVLFEIDSDLEIYPASMTKIMTSIIAFDLLKSGKLSMTDTFTISENAWRMSQAGYSSMFIMVNDEVSVEDLLKGIIIASGNDACIALAEGIAGSEENFADMMNEKAVEIGLTSTNFSNSSGINDPDNFSTVKDIAIMSKYLIKNYPELYKLYAEKEFTWDRTGGDPITQGNRNGLLYNKSLGADGIKTGYLAVEKYSLASSVKKNERRLISVISGAQTKRERTNLSIKLINWGYRNTVTYEVSKKNSSSFELDTWLGKERIVKASTKEDLYITIPRKEMRNFKVLIDYKGPIEAPIKIGDELGSIKVYQKDELIKSAKIYSDQNIKKINFIKSFFMSINYLIWGDV